MNSLELHLVRLVQTNTWKTGLHNSQIYKFWSKMARPFLFKIIEMWFKFPIQDIGHKQIILDIVHVKFRNVTEIFILIKNFKCKKESVDYSFYVVHFFHCTEVGFTIFLSDFFCISIDNKSETNLLFQF